ncbi:uncharacterized protein LOC113238940, partial [Hyposmocoma kahamanoa]|uniref:uncharacterized protein LOC113238940 n=1 Tax=Hyposmocoma kahamanoa TaxID=1477025 RepID=UPI000E6D79E6
MFTNLLSTGILPEALRTKCIRCTDRQKKTAVKVIKRLKSDYPEEWAQLSSRWDPTGDFTRYFEEYLTKDNNLDKVLGTGTNEIPGSSPPTMPPPPSPQPESDTTTASTPVLLNRFGDSAEDMYSSPSSVNGSPMPTVPSLLLTVRPPPQPVRPWMTS